jgi:hypothetical protein
VVLLVGCSSPSEQETRPIAIRSTTTQVASSIADQVARSGGLIDDADTATAAASTPAPSADGPPIEGIRFSSPSGNIVCGHLADDDAVDCSIANKQWEVAADDVPDGGACPLDYGHEVRLQSGGSAAFTCRSDVPWYLSEPQPAPALAYGEFLQVGPFLCLSETKGLSCWEGDDVADGFTMASRTYPLLRSLASALPPPTGPSVGSPGEVVTSAETAVVFSAPSGNIRCGIDLREDPVPDLGLVPAAACWISEKQWEVRPADVPIEEGFGPCDLDYGNEVALVVGRAPSFTCRSDVAWYQLPEGSLGAGTDLGALAYGARLVHGPFTCLSETTGLSCWVDDPSDGFSMARGAYPFG